MVLQDLVSDCCEALKPDVFVEAGREELTLKCTSCGRPAVHTVVISGGTKSRWRCNDYPPGWSDYWKGHAKVLGPPEPEFSDGTPVEHHRTKEPLRVSADKSQERRERNLHRRQAEKGQRPIFFDGGK